MDKTALEYLRDHLQLYRQLEGEIEVESTLLALPNDVQLESLERFQDHPNSIKQAANLHSVSSFCAYINRFGNPDTSIYLDVDHGSFAAVLDHHGQEPAWCKHRATLAPKLSLEWNAWKNIHRKSIGQVTLAHFIEERINDITEPEPGEVLGAALQFQANENLALGSSHNLDDGSVRFTFTKDNTSKTVDFPHRIKIIIPIHENETPNELEARIRYKIDGDGALVFVVSLVKDPSMVVRDELLRLAEEIRKDTEDKHVYEGSI